MVQLVSTVAENVSVSRKADKMYPYLKYRDVEKVDVETLDDIKKNLSNHDIFRVFKENKRIILFLIKKKIIIVFMSSFLINGITRACLRLCCSHFE